MLKYGNRSHFAFHTLLLPPLAVVSSSMPQYFRALQVLKQGQGTRVAMTTWYYLCLCVYRFHSEVAKVEEEFAEVMDALAVEAATGIHSTKKERTVDTK